MTSKTLPDFEEQSTAMWKLKLREAQRQLLMQQERDKKNRKLMDETAEWIRREIKPTGKGLLP